MPTFKEYRTAVNQIFASNTRGGFIDYYHCRRLGGDMTDLITEATKELSSYGEYKELFDLANKAFLKWGKTDKDDSAGDTQIFVYYVEQAWNQVYETNDVRITHTQMYDWFEKHLDGSVIDYMEDILFEYLIHHFPEPDLLQRKQDYLMNRIEKKLQTKESYDQFDADRCREYLLYVMADMQKPIEEIREAAKDTNTYSVKETMAEIEKRYGNLDRVIAIYRELAEEEDKQKWAVDNWHKKLMEIYRDIGDEQNYRAELLSAMAINIGDINLWNEYKRGFTAEQWPKACENIFSTIRTGNFRAFPWYAEEKRYDLIMAGIEAGRYTDALKTYEKMLKVLFPERCLNVLSHQADELADQSSNRKEYRKVAKILQWMQKYPDGKQKAAELAAGYRVKYKHRPAMMDEIAEF